MPGDGSFKFLLIADIIHHEYTLNWLPSLLRMRIVNSNHSLTALGYSSVPAQTTS